MKKSLYILLVILISATIASAQVAEVSKSIISKKTATWCGPCGTWGVELQNQVYSDNTSKAVIMEVHSSSSSALYNPHALEFQNAFPAVSSVPAWYCNGMNLTQYAQTGGIYTNSTRTRIKTVTDSTYNLKPVANAIAEYEIIDDKIKISTETKFFDDASGEFYLAVMLIEDEVVAPQAGIGNNAVHHNVFRGAVTSSVFGELISEVDITKDAIFEKNYEFTLNSNWNKDKIKPILTIWKKIDGKHTFVNASNDVLNVTSVDDLSQSAFKVYPNPASDYIMIPAIDLPSDYATVQIFDVLGVPVFSTSIDNLATSNQINVKHLPIGMYYVRFGNQTVPLQIIR
ncbi:MAG: Omp28-related outer membrane protein [Candidatus Kapabacteria bacterium]|nr:Omp28-related outer membrane protein [Candidatus Kapabacteria bacterium]